MSASYLIAMCGCMCACMLLCMYEKVWILSKNHYIVFWVLHTHYECTYTHAHTHAHCTYACVHIPIAYMHTHTHTPLSHTQNLQKDYPEATSTKVANLPKNKTKNRYPDALPCTFSQLLIVTHFKWPSSLSLLRLSPPSPPPLSPLSPPSPPPLFRLSCPPPPNPHLRWPHQS